MGSWVSASFGYGIVVPNGEDDDYEFDTSPGTFLADYLDSDEVDDVAERWWDASEALAAKLHLTYESGYVHDYGDRTVFFTGQPLSSSGIVTGFTDDKFQGATDITTVQKQALEVAAKTLGIPFDPKWILVASYG